MDIIKNVLNLIENMTILELNSMVNILENKYKLNFDIKGSDIELNKEITKNNDYYSIHLLDFGKNKVSVIKIVKELNNLNLKEAKDLVESNPVILKSDLDFDTSNLIKEKLEKVGAKIKIEKKNV